MPSVRAVTVQGGGEGALVEGNWMEAQARRPGSGAGGALPV
jgi:hypothetical protein